MLKGLQARRWTTRLETQAVLLSVKVGGFAHPLGSVPLSLSDMHRQRSKSLDNQGQEE